jgi:hypothetical protein
LATENDDKSRLAKGINKSNDLSNSEEAVLRVREGITTQMDALLSKKTADPVLLTRLLELEKIIMARAMARKNKDR